MKPDTITVRVVAETELDAESADLTVAVEGAMLFSGTEAFKKAKEVRELIDALRDAGLAEDRVTLRDVRLTAASFALIKSSAAKYTLAIKAVSLERLPAVLGVVASRKHVDLRRLAWNYPGLKEARRRLRREALADALAQARADADVLGVRLLGVRHVAEAVGKSPERSDDFLAEFSDYDLGYAPVKRRRGPAEIGFSLGNAAALSLDLRVEFRVGPFDASGGPAVSRDGDGPPSVESSGGAP